MCGMHRVFESEEELNFLMESTHEEGQADKQAISEKKD